MAKKKLADVNAAENWLNDDLPNILELDVYNCDEFAKIENEKKNPAQDHVLHALKNQVNQAITIANTYLSHI